MTVPLGGFLGAHALAVTQCDPHVAANAGDIVLRRHWQEFPSASVWVDMCVEAVELVREYQADPASHPELGSATP